MLTCLWTSHCGLVGHNEPNQEKNKAFSATFADAIGIYHDLRTQKGVWDKPLLGFGSPHPMTHGIEIRQDKESQTLWYLRLFGLSQSAWHACMQEAFPSDAAQLQLQKAVLHDLRALANNERVPVLSFAEVDRRQRYEVPAYDDSNDALVRTFYRDWLNFTGNTDPWLYQLSETHNEGRPMATLSVVLLKKLAEGILSGQKKGLHPGAKGGVCMAAASETAATNPAWVPHPRTAERYLDHHALSWTTHAPHTRQSTWQVRFKPMQTFAQLIEVYHFLVLHFLQRSLRDIGSDTGSSFGDVVTHYHIVFPVAGFVAQRDKYIGLTNTLRALQATALTTVIGDDGSEYATATVADVHSLIHDFESAPLKDEDLNLADLGRHKIDTPKGVLRLKANRFLASAWPRQVGYQSLDYNHLDLEIRTANYQHALEVLIPAFLSRAATGYVEDLESGGQPMALVVKPSRSTILVSHRQEVLRWLDTASPLTTLIEAAWSHEPHRHSGHTLTSLLPLWAWDRWQLCLTRSQRRQLAEATLAWSDTVRVNFQDWRNNPAPALLAWMNDANFSASLTPCLIPTELQAPKCSHGH